MNRLKAEDIDLSAVAIMTSINTDGFTYIQRKTIEGERK